MLKRALIIGLVAGCAVGLPAAPSWATIDNLKSYKVAYPGKEPKAYSCKVCHDNAVGKKGDLNAYGLALQAYKAAAGAKKLTEEDYRAVETEDADDDKASNLDEINAGTSPSDPASAPTADQSSRAPQADVLHAWLEQLLIPVASAEEPAAATPSETSPAKAEYVGTETCAACHDDIAKRHQRSPHTKIGADGPNGLDISCESCHGPGSLHAEAGGGKGVGGLTNPTQDPGVCYACHTDKKMEFALQYHHPVPEGRMSCTDCHAAHSERPAARSARAQNEQCLQCHEQLKGPWVFEHLAMRDGCVTCHQPHGSITTRLLTERDFNLCLKCHFNAAQYQRIGHYAHRRATNVSGMEGATCTGCHRAVHGSNFSKELRTQ